MTFRSGFTGLAFAGAALLWASTALSQPAAPAPVPAAAPPQAQAPQTPVMQTPVMQTPAAPPQEPQPLGPEALEAMHAPPAATPDSAPAEPAAPPPGMGGTLNAQYAALLANPALAAPEAEPAPPPAVPVAPVGVAPLPPPGVQLAAAAAAAPPVPEPAVARFPAAPVDAPPALTPVVQPVALAAPVQAAPSAPSVALSRRVVESAVAFLGYMQRASALKPQWVDAPGVAHALEVGAIYEQGELEEGEIAYGALVALQDPRFVQSIRAGVVDPAQREAIAHALLSDPGMVLQVPGARDAALRAAAALGRLGYGLDRSGAAVKQSAYDVQHSVWSLANVAEPQAVLLRLKARSAEREALGEDGGRTLLASLTALPADEDAGAVRRVTPVVARGLTLAALAVMGEAGEDHGATLLPILADSANAQCVKMARLNLYQCLSVAGPQYEDIFCLGEHAMMETARCVEAASGWTPAAAAVVPAMMAAAPAPASVAPAASIYVPAALGAEPYAPRYTLASAGPGQR